MIHQLLSGIHSKELKTNVHIKIHTGIFIAARFIIGKTGALRHPSVGEWINCDTSREWNIIQG